jgi:uncharacterized membrane protein
MKPLLNRHKISFAVALITLSVATHAQPATKAPTVQYWMDISTSSMMGMDEMPELPPGMGGMMAGMMGANSATGRDGRQAKGIGNLTKNMMMGRWLDTALYTSRKPDGGEATHQIPPGAGVGAASLRLVTPPREGLPGSDDAQYPERPQGRILFYWGCSAQVKAGQPRVFDMSKFSAQEYAGFMQGRSVRDRGARAEAGHAIWPNDKQNSRIVRDASLIGDHTISGDGVPANMRFTLGPGQDFMPTLQVESIGKLSDTIRVNWQRIASARAYMLTAMSGSDGKSGGPELVIWSASEPPESGMGLMDYVSNGNIDKWLGERVLLPATQTQCEIPAGIFAKSDGAMLRAIAYGSEANFSYPPRPANLAANAAWTPEWSVRVRSKSLSMNALGDEANAAANRSSNSRNSQRAQTPQQEEKTPSLVPDVGGLLKGIFGR